MFVALPVSGALVVALRVDGPDHHENNPSCPTYKVKQRSTAPFHILYLLRYKR